MKTVRASTEKGEGKMGILKFLVFWGLGIASLILQGYVLSIMWKWFLVTSLEAPPLEVAPAIGLALIVSLLIARWRDTKEDKQEEETRKLRVLVFALIYPPIILGTGWIVKMFM
ncbi:MAG: hypothetical protein U9Q07_03760 [Planctomycetota bacterium]|nr:hypothetical protein [Planctomycetota bacterium]